MSKKSLPKPKSKSNLDKLKNVDCQPILTKEHPELDLKFVIDQKVRKGLKHLVKEDDAPELTQSFFDSADLYEGKKIKSRGRPKSLVTKQPVKLRLDADVLAALRASGEGWQTRINDTLRASLKL